MRKAPQSGTNCKLNLIYAVKTALLSLSKTYISNLIYTKKKYINKLKYFGGKSKISKELVTILESFRTEIRTKNGREDRIERLFKLKS